MFALPPAVADLMQELMPCVFVFGVGIDAPSRYSTSIARVNSSFLRRSGVRNADANALSTDPPGAGPNPGQMTADRPAPAVDRNRTDPHRLTVGGNGRTMQS